MVCALAQTMVLAVLGNIITSKYLFTQNTLGPNKPEDSLDSFLQISAQLIQLPTQRQINALRARLSVLQDEARKQVRIHLGLNLDVLALGHLVELVGNQPELVLAQRDCGCHGGNLGASKTGTEDGVTVNLGASDFVVLLIEFANNKRQLCNTLLVHQEAEEILSDLRHVGLLGDLEDNVFLLVPCKQRVVEECGESLVRQDSPKAVHVSVELLQTIALLAQVNEGVGVVLRNSGFP